MPPRSSQYGADEFLNGNWRDICIGHSKSIDELESYTMVRILNLNYDYQKKEKLLFKEQHLIITYYRSEILILHFDKNVLQIECLYCSVTHFQSKPGYGRPPKLVLEARKKAALEPHNDMNNVIAPNTFGPHDMICTICMDYPPSHMYQCVEGHIYCESCFNRLSEQKRNCCSTCHKSIDFINPVRHRFKEQILAGMLVRCLFFERGCKLKLKFSERDKHIVDGGFVGAVCDGEHFGCPWNGIKSEKAVHELDCNVMHANVPEVVDFVPEKVESFEKKIWEMKSELSYYKQSTFHCDVNILARRKADRRFMRSYSLDK